MRWRCYTKNNLLYTKKCTKTTLFLSKNVFLTHKMERNVFLKFFLLPTYFGGKRL